MGKKALVVVSFGTSYPQARTAIAQIEQALASAYPDYDFFRAFTSGIIIRKIEREEGIHIPTPEECMEKLAKDGYTEVICQSLHVIPGHEYEKMCAQIQPFAKNFTKFLIGKPLLYTEDDYLQLCKNLQTKIPALEADAAFVYMGHGTDHIANASYALVENTFRYLGAERVYVATVEGFPNFAYVLKRLETHQVRKVWLAPLMIVAGDHAQNDLAGEEDSWKTELQARGYEVAVQLTGLGEYSEIAQQFAAHLPE